jgi:hypothetical protein
MKKTLSGKTYFELRYKLNFSTLGINYAKEAEARCFRQKV